MVNFGNWIRKVCPWIREATEPLKDEEDTSYEMSVVDQIVFCVLRDNEITGEGYESCNGHVVSVGDLLIYKNFNSSIARVKYKGEDIGFCSNPTLLTIIGEKLRKYHERLEEKLEPERAKRQEQREEFLKQVLKEVSKDVS